MLILKEKSYLSVVVYLGNKTKYTNKFIYDLNIYLFNNFEKFEIILVNNGNKEYDSSLIEFLKGKFSGHTTIINLPWKQNTETAMLAGEDLSIGDFIIEIDSPENIDNLSIIKKLMQRCTEGFDIVSATPNKKKDRLSQWFYNFVYNFSNTGINLNSEPIRIITRRALNSALRSKEKVRYRQILYLLTGFPISHITYNLTNKYYSNKNLGEKISLGLEIILSYTDFGIKLTFGLSLVFLLMSMCVGIYTVYIYLTLKQVAQGWTTTMLFLSFGFSGFFLIAGILTKYLVMVLSESKDRPPYTIQSINKYK